MSNVKRIPKTCITECMHYDWVFAPFSKSATL